MTHANWSSRATSLVATLLAVGLLSGCITPETTEQTGSAELKVLLPQGLESANVALVRVTVEGPGIPAPIQSDLTRTATGWEGVISNIPAGFDRTFSATAYDAAYVPLYHGSAGPISVVSGSTASVNIVLQQVNPPPPFENVAPIIESLAASSNPVQPGSVVSLVVKAYDPNPGDTLSYQWSGAAGTFSSATSSTTSWTAPALEGVHRVQVEVKDSRGASATVSLEMYVQAAGATGSVTVTAGFNSWPSISSMTGTPSPMQLQVPIQLSVQATDADGDALSYSWGTNCYGYFDNPYTATPSFTLYEPPYTGSCSFYVGIADGRGGMQQGALTLHMTGYVPNQPPVVNNAYVSAPDVGAYETVSLGVSAYDPEGSPLYFSWTASAGTFRSIRDTASTSDADWMAPSCLNGPVYLSVYINDSSGMTTTHSFTLNPRPGSSCGSVDGGYPDGGPGDGGYPDGGADAGPGVSGMRNGYHVIDSFNIHVVPEDMSAATIAAWVPADGGYSYFPGYGRPDGTFSIPGVNTAPYLLQFNGSYVWSYGSTVDLSSARLGRPGVAEVQPGNQLELNLSLPTPWRAENDLQLAAPSAGVGYFSAAGCSYPSFPGVEGSTSIVGNLDYYDSLQACGNVPARLDTGMDPIYVTHLESRSDLDAGVSIQEVRQSQVSGYLPETMPGSFQLAGSLGYLPTYYQPVDFRASEFESLALTTHPNAQLVQNNLNIGLLQGARSYGTYAGWPDLALAFDSTPGQGNAYYMFEYGDPYPMDWDRFVTGGASAAVYYSVPLATGGSSTPRSISALVSTREPLQQGVTQMVWPQVGPPTSLRINGLSATDNRSAVGATPVLSWSPPMMGVASRYVVRIYRLYATSTGSTGRQTVASLTTTQTQLQLPPNLLTLGYHYVFQVYAYNEPSFDPSRPYMGGPYSAYASALTGLIQP